MGLTSKAKPSGLATLDASGLLPSGQLPSGFGAQAAAVADQAALTATAPAALTGAAAATNPPTKVEYDKTVADVVALRTTLAAVVVDLGVERTKLNALLASLRTATLLAP
jgi:hypothetical protein